MRQVLMAIAKSAVVTTVVLGLSLGAVVAALAFNLTSDLSGRDERGEITDDGGVGVFRLRVRDCFTFPDRREGYITGVHGMPCDEPHDGQVFAEFDVGGGSSQGFPGEDEMAEAGFTGCDQRWPAAIDGRWGIGGLYDLSVLYPSWSTWLVGDRTVICTVVRLDGGELRGDLL